MTLLEKYFKLKKSITESTEVSTGNPISLFYSRNTKSSKNFKLAHGVDVGRHLEPHGEYMNVDHSPLKAPDSNWETGSIHFKNPLVLPHKSTDSHGWKKDLSDLCDGKTGKVLSEHLKKIGHDGIITQDKYGLNETVNLNGTKTKN